MEHIDLNGERFCVTQNLAEALRRLRQADQTEIMWIDALCIKQNDDEEKSTQVPLMGLIYEQAESVIAFLGKHDKTTPSLFWFLENLEKTDDIGRALESNHTFIPALHTFLCREYWQRAWIVQELILNQNKWIQCGSDRVSYLTMERLQESDLSYALADISPMDSSPVHGVCYRIEWHPRCQQLGSLGTELSAYGFLEGFLDVRCSNPRDHIYAFYNLLPAFKKHLKVDYKKSPEQVICEAAKSIIMETQSLHIITLRGRQAEPQEECMKWQYAMPSWCPFFGVPYISDPLPRGPTRSYETGGNVSDGKHLRVKGVVLGMICETGPQRSINDLRFEKIDFIHDKLRFHDELAYAHKCVAFIKQRAGIDYDLNRTVLADIVAGDNKNGTHGLLYCLEKGTEHDTTHMDSLNDFARFFHSRQLCIFGYDDPSIYASSLKETRRDIIASDLAIIPGRACPRDVLCAIIGTEHPIVLRRQDEQYEVLGEAKIFSRVCDDILTHVGPSKHRLYTSMIYITIFG